MKNADVSRTEGLTHVIDTFFASSSVKVSLCKISYLWDMYNGFSVGSRTFKEFKLQFFNFIRQSYLLTTDSDNSR